VSAGLARAGQFLPVDPPHADAATIGGIVAANSNGFWRARYGAVRDLLIGTRTALADGTIVRGGGRVVKNVAGYDLNKLLVGSYGTLGVIVEATFKVLPLPAASGELAGRFVRSGDAFAAATAIARGAARPAAIVVEQGADGWTLHVEARGDRAVVGRTLADADDAVAAHGGRVEHLDGALAALRELPARATEGALIRVALPLAAQGPFAEMAARVETFEALVADVASGIVRAHLIGPDDAVVRDADGLVLAARAVGGSGRVERRGATLASRLSAWPNEPKGHFLMKRIKDAFDPACVLEPGRSAVG
jgi:glycolate oxidase FAD binding subunit